ncbi:MAG: hypothetical protein IJD18_00740, partial [Clostridia bacterium]|nr:hypothetical protein [Clostridia bacterium]
ASIIFYAWGEPKNVMLLIFVIFFNWLMGILVDRYREKKKLAYTAHSQQTKRANVQKARLLFSHFLQFFHFLWRACPRC